jgi:hypothetical protein
MRALVTAAAFLFTARSVHAEFAGFDVGNGVPLTGGVVRVNYMGSKSHTFSFGPRLRVRLMEVQITVANGKTKRHAMFFAGNHALRVPLPIELVEVLSLLLLTFLCCVIIVLHSTLRSKGVEPGAPPDRRQVKPTNNCGVS